MDLQGMKTSQIEKKGVLMLTQSGAEGADIRLFLYVTQQ